MNKVSGLGSLLLVCLACQSFVLAQAPHHKVVQEIVGPAWTPGMSYTLSPRGSRLATTHQKEGRWYVAIDNVDGEPFDDILKAACHVAPQFNDADIVIGQSISNPGTVVFSADGLRFAYAGRRGEEVIVIADGKEMFRAKHSLVAPPVQFLQFSPDGHHLFFYSHTGDTMQSNRLMMDGRPVTPPFDRTPPLFFSPDGSRWILNGGRAKQPLEKLLVIDGTEPGYTAERARFSPDSQHVVVSTGGRGEQKLLRDGKVVLDTKATIERFRISANGDIAALVQKIQYDPEQALFLNGKRVPGLVGVRDIRFSPDGKRWAAICSRDMNKVQWVVLDGKKHREYGSVSDIYFTPDSSMCLYIAESDSKSFLVNNGVEDEGHAVMRGLAFGDTGNLFAYGAGPNVLNIHHAGRVSPPHRNVFRLEISPDGRRIAYYAVKGPTEAEFWVDGEIKGSGGAFGEAAVFSPDSKHLAANARTGNEGNTIYIDGRFVPARRSSGVPLAFTPDNRHLIIRGSPRDPANPNTPLLAFYLDGEMVARFSSRGVQWINTPSHTRLARGALPWGVSTAPKDADEWEILEDGRIVFVGPAVAGDGVGPMTRVTVTPSPDTTFNTWFDDIGILEEQEAAAAHAAKEKAAAEKAEAAGRAKAAAAEAAAKRKAAADAKAKARQDALDARKKK